MPTDVELYNFALREDFIFFADQAFATLHPGQTLKPNWHIEHLAWKLQTLPGGARLAIAMPPRYLKSFLASVAYPAWVIGRNPSTKIICASYGDELARTHARECRKLLAAPWYRRAFPDVRIAKDSETEFTTERHGFRLAASMTGSVTGRGGDLIVIDDPVKVQGADYQSERERVNEIFDGTLVTRLNDKEAGQIIVVMHRLHEDDLIGHVTEKGGWDLVSLPAIATEPGRFQVGADSYHDRQTGDVLHPAFESASQIERMRRDMTSSRFEAQYQQNPVPAGGNLFRREWFPSYRSLPTDEEGGIKVQSWDTAISTSGRADWSVCTTWIMTSTYYHLVDVYRARLEFPALLEQVKEQASLHAIRTVLIEEAGAGQALCQELERESGLEVIPIRPADSKEMRAAQQSVAFRAKRVLFPEDAPWLAELERELLTFPNGRHDDQVDSVVQFLAWARESQIHILGVGPEGIPKELAARWIF